MLYAWDVLDEADLIDAFATDTTSLVDLFARVLNTATDRLIRRGLDRAYIEMRDILPGVRGRVDISVTAKSLTLRAARISCVYDELDHDLVHNQIIKATIRKLLMQRELCKEMKDSLAETYRRLRGVSDINISGRSFRAVQLHNNNREYVLPLAICRVLFHHKLLTAESDDTPFARFVEDIPKMRKLFERFIRKFYAKEQREFRVCGNGLRWNQTRAARGETQATLLPRMRTDVRLKSDSRAIVIETKFVPRIFQEFHGKKTLITSHVYQLFAYLRNLAALGDVFSRVEGFLLYPANPTQHDSVNLEYELDGHHFRVVTIDLSQHHSAIRRDLLGLLTRR